MATALLGLGLHFVIAFGAATTFVLAARGCPCWWAPIPGAGFGVAWGLHGMVVLPLSRVQRGPFHLGLMLNGVIGHALFVGLPVALAASPLPRQGRESDPRTDAHPGPRLSRARSQASCVKWTPGVCCAASALEGTPVEPASMCSRRGRGVDGLLPEHAVVNRPGN